MAGDAPDRFTVDFAGLTLLGVYQVETKLAEGGMGSIYRATDTNLDRPVVIKVPHPRFLGEPGFRERFSREVEELIRLEHPRVARILARGEHDDVPFFVLQYLGGGSLEDRLRATADRDPVDVLGWLVAIAETLDFVHDRGIVHRDIKPGNILFDEAGNVFLSDFGVAKVYDADAGITESGVGIGSPRYMAPEQGMGVAVTAAADQYALAATVYEALAGRPPFDGTVFEVMVSKAQEDPAALSEPGVPAGAAAAVMTALSRDASTRFPSCGAFAQAYRAGLAEAGLITTDSTPVRTTIPAPPKRAGHAVLAIAVVVLLGVLGFFALKGDEPVEPPPQEKVRRVLLLDAGAEPRAVLGYRELPGTRQTPVLTMGLKMTTESLGEEPRLREPPREAIESEVRTRAGEGVPFGLTVTSGPRSGATAIGHLTRGGILDSLEFDEAEEGQADLRRIAAVLRQLPVPLPAEPIGVGATWELTETVDLFGTRMVQTTRYQLMKREGDRLHVRISTAEVAPPQELRSLGSGLDVKISNFIATGEGTSVIDLGLPFPVTSSYRLAIEMAGELNGKAATISIELTTEVEPR